MVNIFLLFLIMITMLIITRKGTAAIRCYSCDSRDSKNINMNCENLNSNAMRSDMVTECPSQCIVLKLFLRGTTNNQGGMEEVTKRFCGLEEMSICELMKNHLENDEDFIVNDCTSCESDFCNGPKCELPSICKTEEDEHYTPLLIKLGVIALTLIAMSILSTICWFAVQTVAPKIAHIESKPNKDSTKVRHHSENSESQAGSCDHI